MEKKVAIESLGRVLADTYVLMLKTQNAHWNVKGQDFYPVHMMTEDQYNELFTAIDEIAERMRALGGDVPGTMSGFLKLTRLDEGLVGNSVPEISLELAKANQRMSELIRQEIDLVDDADEDGTEDMLVGRLRAHEKVTWMWNAMVGLPTVVDAKPQNSNAVAAKSASKDTKVMSEEKKEKPASVKPVVQKPKKEKTKKKVSSPKSAKSGRMSPRVSGTG